MAETPNDYIDRLVAARDAARSNSLALRRLAAAAVPELGARADAARAMAASVKALGQEITAEAERLERKL